MSENAKLGFLLSFTGLFTLTFDTLLIKLTSEEISTWKLIFYRYISYSTVVLIYNIINFGSNVLNVTQKTGISGFFLTLNLTICNLCFIFSLNYTTVANVLCIFSLSSILTTVLSWLTFKQKLNWWTIVSLFSTTFIIILIIYLDLEEEDKKSKNDNLIGCTLATGALISTSIYFTIIKYNQIKYPDREMISVIYCSGFLTSLIALIVMNIQEKDTAIYNYDILWIGLQGFMILPIAFVCVTESLKYISSTEGNMMFTLETILGPLWVSVAGIERISYLNIIGIVLVVLFLLFNGIMTIRYS